jgi:putative membrane protein
MKFIVQIIISTLAVLVSAYIIPGIEVTSFFTAVVVAAVMAFLNTFLKPILIFFTIPFTLVTLGLFLLVINAAIVILTSKLIDGFLVSGFWSALFFSIVLSIVTSIFNKMAKKEDENSENFTVIKED